MFQPTTNSHQCGHHMRLSHNTITNMKKEQKKKKENVLFHFISFLHFFTRNQFSSAICILFHLQWEFHLGNQFFEKKNVEKVVFECKIVFLHFSWNDGMAHQSESVDLKHFKLSQTVHGETDTTRLDTNHPTAPSFAFTLHHFNHFELEN